jgi:hypothetical protein
VAGSSVAVSKGPKVDVGGVCGEEAAFFVDWDPGGEGGVFVVCVVIVDPVASPPGRVCGRGSDAGLFGVFGINSLALSVQVVDSAGRFVVVFFSSAVGPVEYPGPVVVKKFVSFS